MKNYLFSNRIGKGTEVKILPSGKIGYKIVENGIVLPTLYKNYSSGG